MDTYSNLAESIARIKVIDTHEHLPPFESMRDMETDILKEYLYHYVNRDLMTAGMSEEIYRKAVNPSLPLKERWHMIEPYWKVARFSGYSRCLEISARELYGVPGLNSDTIESANDGFLSSLKPGHFQKVLKEKSGIVVSLLDAATVESDRNLYRNVARLDIFAWPVGGQNITDVERFLNVRICSFKDWLDACADYIDKMLSLGIVCFKNSLAYRRSLLFPRATYGDAERQFNEMLKSDYGIWRENRTFSPGVDFQNFMVHYTMNCLNKVSAVIQIHTGLLEGYGNIIHHSDPALLSNLFYDYPDVTFDIFHIGYPYHQTLTAIAKMFPNVFIDMCWAHIISPVASRSALSEWIEAIPYSRICGFGGDFCFIDGVLGHQAIARDNIAQVLADKVASGRMDQQEALEVAEALLYTNPKRVFRLNDLDGPGCVSHG